MSFYFAFKPADINRALGTKLRSPYHVEKNTIYAYLPRETTKENVNCRGQALLFTAFGPQGVV